MNTNRIFAMPFASVYPMYIAKAEKKGRTKEEVDRVIFWLTGYDAVSLKHQLDRSVGLADFFAEAPRITPDAVRITGVICGYRMEDIEDPTMQKIRWLDKLVAELSKGRPLEKILRK